MRDGHRGRVTTESRPRRLNKRFMVRQWRRNDTIQRETNRVKGTGAWT
jgi:hypothetical protein